jgi:DNA (cytosine-5)-methyltransferase 1
MQRSASCQNRENRDVISLFSGAMGLDIGLGSAGLNVKIGQDVDASCVKTMQQNGHEVIAGDIRGIYPEQLLEASALRRSEPFLICGGPPCQPFSTAGKRMGINDPRGSLFMDFIRMLDYIRPRFFIMENVKGLLSSTVNGEKRQTPQLTLEDFRFENTESVTNDSVLEIVLSEFGKLGYKTVYGLLDAVNYGVPQFRERFVLIGSRDGENVFLPMPTHFQTHQDDAYRWTTLRTAIKDLEDESGECTYFSPERMAFLKTVPEGGNWRNLAPDCVEKAMGGAYHSGGGKVGFYRRLSYNEPAPTLVTSPVQKASMLCHPTEDRPLSVREYARIQQFPDEWTFHGNTASKYRQIGNAVPIGLAKALGTALIATANGTSTVTTKRTRGTDVHNRIRSAIEIGGGYGNQSII